MVCLTGVEAIRDILKLARDLPPAVISRWTVDLGVVRLECRATNPAIAALMERRMANRQGCGGTADFSFDLIETDVVGWTSPSQWAGSAIERAQLNQNLADQGIGAFIPPDPGAEQHFPWMIYDPIERRGVVLVRSATDTPPWLVSAPFAQLLHFALATRGARLVHAGALGNDHGGVLLVGPAGAGKSATTLAGLVAGLSTVGDDLVIVDAEDAPTAWPVYPRFKQFPSGLARFPALRQAAGTLQLNWNGKVDFGPELVRPGCFLPCMPLRGIYAARIASNAVTMIEPARGSDVFSIMARDMFALMPGARAAGFSFLTRLTRRLPTFWLDLSDDPEEIGSRIASHIGSMAA